MYFQIHKLTQRFPSENTLFTKDVGTQDQVLWLKLMMFRYQGDGRKLGSNTSYRSFL